MINDFGANLGIWEECVLFWTVLPISNFKFLVFNPKHPPISSKPFMLIQYKSKHDSINRSSKIKHSGYFAGKYGMNYKSDYEGDTWPVDIWKPFFPFGYPASKTGQDHKSKRTHNGK